MLFATIILFIIFLFIILLIKLKNFSIKIFLSISFIFVVFITALILFKTPEMHNEISLSVINYLIKFNADGSTTTTKQTTTQVFEGTKNEE